MSQDITLFPDQSGNFRAIQLTFAEDKYCEQRALGKKKRAAYRLAYPEDTLSPDKTIDSAASRLEARAEIQARITEWILDKTEDEKIAFRADRQWAINETRNQLKKLAIDPVAFAKYGVKLLEFLGKLEGWFTERIEVAATATDESKRLFSEEANARFQLLIEKAATSCEG
jgi:hypothetical protein